ncbi:MAG: hypothetical protein US60_C0029G0001 [Microgenomates group bacterium GW2011_GWC1_37_8]|uniref:HD/PDEase domain-containing protein n=1 Tax=Candidatus Woesebacteria bacterium GW2011_GWB1_38_8 TaxID=1618570 RepID=A0A0G0NJ86_9BACT|nr:MAG: hypothetical protein US60_C0029G0001 [Microgenomates group bacterium GW2011_GWC1_37_8]KKQ85979.1 MAG: hypothetical protein UT08_C0002G0001 [Candidatus Woesebacteria bacterium GW2011_GWB1_38_8]
MVKKKQLSRCLEYHKLYPFDPIHDIKHHQRVLKNVSILLEKENLKHKVNTDALLIAACLHDAIDEKRAESIVIQFDKLTYFLNKIELEKKLKSEAVRILKEHSFGKKQDTLEQKVLYDSDKIDYSNKKRVDFGVDSVKRGRMSNKKLRFYFKLWAKRASKVLSTLHFETSRHLYVKNSIMFYRYVEKIYPIYFPLIKKINPSKF